MIIRAWVQTVRVMDEQAVILLFVFKWQKCKAELIRACPCYLSCLAPAHSYKCYSRGCHHHHQHHHHQHHSTF